jgi:hypothetical protein
MNTIVYGLRIQANVPLPWCDETPPQPPDLRFLLASAPSTDTDATWESAALWYASPFHDAAGTPGAIIRRAPDGQFRLAYSDGSVFIVDPSGHEVRAAWSDPSLEGSALAFLLGPVLGWVLRLRGITCMHASALEVGGKALLLVGAEGAGKSTTASGLLRAGHAVLSDDVVPLQERDGELWVNPGLPRLLLGAESAKELWQDQGDLTPHFPGSDKGYVDRSAPSFRFCGNATPLGAVYFLERRDPTLRQTRIQPVTGATALTRLAANTFANRVPNEAMARSDFELLGRLLNRYPVRSVTAPDDLRRVGALCRDLVEDFLATTCDAAST